MGNWLFNDEEISERARIRNAGPEELPFTKEWFRREGKKVYCYGAGGTLLFALHSLGGLKAAGVVDSNPALWGKTILGYAIKPPDALLADRENAVAVLSVNTSPAHDAISRWCRENKIQCVAWHDVNNLSDRAKWTIDLEAIPEAEVAAGMWADVLSRETYCRLLKNYASFSPAKYPEQVPDHYFQDFVPRKFYRNFVDLGAFQGDTLAAYREWMRDDFDAYYAVEAIPENFAALRDHVSDERVRLFNTAVGATTGTVRMRHDPANLYAASISDDGDFEAPVTTLDDLLAAHAHFKRVKSRGGRRRLGKLDILALNVALVLGRRNFVPIVDLFGYLDARVHLQLGNDGGVDVGLGAQINTVEQHLAARRHFARHALERKLILLYIARKLAVLDFKPAVFKRGYRYLRAARQLFEGSALRARAKAQGNVLGVYDALLKIAQGG